MWLQDTREGQTEEAAQAAEERGGCGCIIFQTVAQPARKTQVQACQAKPGSALS